jgi:phosphoglycolate phosphatase
MNERNAIVFDFDGTLVDVEKIINEIYTELATKRGWPIIDKKTYKMLKTGGAKVAMKLLGVRFWQLPKLLTLGRAEYRKRHQEIKLFPGITRVLNRLDDDYDIYVLSSNDEQTVEDILRENKVKNDITVLKGSSLFGKSKPLKKLLKNNNYSAHGSWMIGDEIRDIEAGRKAGMNTIAVAWGLQTQAGLKTATPSHIAKKPEDILRFIISEH